MSKEIREMYRSKGVTPPDGKGIHTKKFHDVASSVMASGSADNPYAVAMSQLGRNKAVKKSHWDKKSAIERRVNRG